MQGHGVRLRQVVVPPLVEAGQPRVCECWERRYRCVACRVVLVVLPRGVMPRYLYSAAAIVTAFFLVAEPPIGEGLTDAAAYRRQGMYCRLSSDAEADPQYRWRSPGRWARLAEEWWPDGAGRGLGGLLVLFLERAGGRRGEALRVAVDGHVRWGCPM